MPQNQRICVIGAGIVGVAAASYLLRDGHDVTLVDRAGPGEGTSKGNAGALSPGSCVPLAMPGMLRKVPSWLMDPDGPLTIRPSYLPRALPWLVRFLRAGREDRVGPIADAMRALHGRVFDDYGPLVKNAGCEDLIHRTGMLIVFASADSLASFQPEIALRRDRGVKVDVLDAPELRQMAPALSPRYTHGILLPEHGFAASPYRLVNVLAERLIADGGRFRRAEARRLRVDDDGVTVELDGGEALTADRVVVAAGAWSGALVRPLGLRVPLETHRGYHMTIPGMQERLRLPVTASDEKVFFTPMAEGLRVAGTVEFAGLEAPPNWHRARRLLDIAKRVLPGLSTEGATQWMGHRPCLPDSLPAIGRLPQAPRVLAAFGHSHYGMTSGPVTGRLIADLVAGRRPPIDLAPYRPDRF